MISRSVLHAVPVGYCRSHGFAEQSIVMVALDVLSRLNFPPTESDILLKALEK